MTEYRLRIRNKLTGLVLHPDENADHCVVCDKPIMWRIHYRGRVSDMVNIARAKDAAYSWLGLTEGGQRHEVKWEYLAGSS
jgi:hypothetical protein